MFTMLPILLLVTLSGPAMAYKGSSAWFYSEEDCQPEWKEGVEIDNKDHQKWSMGLGIERGNCWKHENGQDRDGARRKSVWIDPPNEANGNVDGCLQMWTDTTCKQAAPVQQVSFQQNRNKPIALTLDNSTDPLDLGYASYKFLPERCEGSFIIGYPRVIQ